MTDTERRRDRVECKGPQFSTIAKVLKAVGGQITVNPIPAQKKKTIAQQGFHAIGG